MLRADSAVLLTRQLERDSAEAMERHAVCIPTPAQGHINSMHKLAKFLHSNSFHITFVYSENNYNRILKSNPSFLQGPDDFRFETIPDGLAPSDNTDVGQDTASLAESTGKGCTAPFRNLLTRLSGPSSGVPPVTCIISDAFMSFTLDVAAEFGIPDIFFCSVSACGYMSYFQFKELIKRDLLPLKSESDLTNGYLETIIDWVPGMNNIKLRDLASFVRTDPDNILLNSVKYETERASKATAIIINTFDDLERPVLDALTSMLPPIYTVGPLSLLSYQSPSRLPASVGSSMWKEDHNCLEWLERKKHHSVLYVNFGSMVVTTNEHLVEFAWGIANSGFDFLWVIRPDLVKGELAVLPPEFQSMTKEKGMLTAWCPQEQVLAHPSIGGFLNHGGWNSITESISHGVPMLCWPYFGDQQINCHYVCDEWGIGMEIDNDVKRKQVEGLIRELMNEEKGKDMKKKALEWKERAIKAIKPGGSSFANLDKVIKDLLL